MEHVSVLLKESITYLNIKDGDIIVDGTFGGGGHSSVLRKEYPESTLICVDLDPKAKQRFMAHGFDSKKTHFISSNFKDATFVLSVAHKETVDRVLLDLGTSAFQLLEDDRGFSFRSDTPLSMAFGGDVGESGLSAYDIVNSWSPENLSLIIFRYGEEKRARKITQAIVDARERKPIATSYELALVIEEAIGTRGKIHPATKTFQAIRIAVNNELVVLEEALTNWFNKLSPGGRIAVITFHSLEDRIVKHFFKSQQLGRVITKKPISPTREEIINNPKARSAKLRVIEKI